MWAVVVFAHNEERSVENALDRILTEGRDRPMRIHVVANGCTDGTVKLVKHYARAQSQVRLHQLDEADKALAWSDLRLLRSTLGAL